MNLDRIDLNLLVYLDVLLREGSVTKAAQQLGITQPAMSNGLRRLRELFSDPLLVRTSDGMTPTERAQELQPMIRKALGELEMALQPLEEFDAKSSNRVFRIMVSDYAESTLVPELVKRLRTDAPDVILDVLTPSDVTFKDVEAGKVDMAINRFDEMPQSFHQMTLWQDDFVCLVNPQHPLVDKFDLDAYLSSKHIWVSKTGMGAGVGIDPEKVIRLGWVDNALSKLGHKRRISVFTRHYQMPALLALNNDLVATLPRKVADMQAEAASLEVRLPPFKIPPFELKMAWSPLVQHHQAHRWLRRTIVDVAQYC
ncbi:MAG: LysR family transcriptional regulator [Oceanospirillaceae bacterium]|uniref:LysR family transcriptional regulator n=1 Tax=unclassified Thalassolituus TaxID=2624967 RepID=UPI000C0B3AA0|nr:MULTISPECIES: LysR family transcriptional regulator [unclassified Thalassolituus]MAK91936.1 LysR family transcriptional regulator [Thalassolituus sp.]MBL34931.1 LysR family transcriptional regulator [Oceanospirillaceae bacterium]MBS53659.1 LysR family transcriptional regulator [Oceanospirillaceae bacterium]